MNEELRKSPAARSVAMGFIILLLLGNFYIVLAVIGSKPPGMLVDGIVVGAFWVIASGLWLALTKLKQVFFDGRGQRERS